MHRKFIIGLCWALTAIPLVAPAQESANAAETLKQHVAALQKAPGDQALREKIIKLALTFDPKPEIPEDAERFNARGKAAVKEAQSQKDFAEAAAEFEKATLAAPWLANPYYNLADTQGKAGDYAKAAQNLKLYLLAAPDSPDAKAVKELMYEMEFKAEKLAKSNAEQQQREQAARGEQQRREQQAATERLRQEQIVAAQRVEAGRGERAREEKRGALKSKYVGAVWILKRWGSGNGDWNKAFSDFDTAIKCDGRALISYTVAKNMPGYSKGDIIDDFTVDLADLDGNDFSNVTSRTESKYTISRDGRTITCRTTFQNQNGVRVSEYERQK